ncbi:MAG: hypothetical protein AB7K71_35160 [Polyangiaceae bacterium]
MKRRLKPPPAGLRLGLQVSLLCALLVGCKDLERYDTGPGEAYCGNIVGAEFIRTPERLGGFSQELRIRVTLDTEHLDTAPGTLSSNDIAGPCAPEPTFDAAPLIPVQELSSDPLSQLSFGDGRDFSFLAWAESSCRGPMLVVVSLMNDRELELRLLKPPTETDAGPRPAFALFRTQLSTGTCGF